MIFSDNDIIKIKKCEEATPLELSNGYFFVKKAFDSEEREEYALSNLELGIREIIYSLIAQDIGLVCPNVYLVKDNNNIFIVTEDLNFLGNFNTLEELGLSREESSSLYEIWNFFSQKYSQNQKIMADLPNIFNDLLKIYFLDIFLGSWDRVNRNIGFLNKENGVNRLVPFDNEYTFSYFIHNISSQYEGNKWFDFRKKLDRKTLDDYENTRKEAIIGDLKELLRTSSKETWDIFYNLFLYLTPEYIEYIFKEIESNHYLYGSKKEKIVIPHKEVLMANYLKDYGIIKEAWKGLKSGRK